MIFAGKIEMRKKGQLLSKTLGILIAVLCILVLLVLAVNLYGILIGKSDIEYARATLDELHNRISNLKAGEQKSFIFLNPEDWYIVRYDNARFEGKCNSDFCLCLCDTDDCSVRNVCKEFSKQIILIDLEETSSINKDPPFSLTLSNDEKIIIQTNP